eukprot:m.206776 g.206776  ORF g.206776 m.206776 type:complete len:532 (+) comp23479_c0_seq1:99-1694(+)
MDADLIATLSGITGLPADQAAMYLEMSGGNLDMAVSIFFDGGGGGGGGSMGADGQGAGSSDAGAFDAPTPAHALLFGPSPAPPSWADQGFQWSDATGVGLTQRANGPCGILAAVNAEVVARMGRPDPQTPVPDRELTGTLAAVLARCATSDCITVASWEADTSPGTVLKTTEVAATDTAAMEQAVADALPSYTGPGGVVLLCYSAVLTRGLDNVRADVAADNGELPLVYGPHSLCSSELVNLIMEGMARGNVSAYDPTGAKATWRVAERRAPIGMLSRAELDSGVPLADEFKSPPHPVYLVHGGDHFTFMWAAGAPPDGDAVTWHHWNGLPPNQALTTFTLQPCSLDALPPSPMEHAPTHWKPVLGELESIVQADATDKAVRPGQWRSWRYELALINAVVLAEDSSPERPADAPAPVTYPQGDAPAGKWRCGSCYQTRFKTMCFGDNEAGRTTCAHCNLPQAEAGWTIWRTYDELPAAARRRIDHNFGPKVLAVLRTRWPDAELIAHGAGGTTAVAGGVDFDNRITPLPSV